MAKFNLAAVRAAVRSPIRSGPAASGHTYNGAPGFARDAKGELFLLAVTNMVGEDTFYEGAGTRDQRYERLVHEVAVADPAWMLDFLTWLRSEANLRSASLVGAAEAVRARLAATGAAQAPGTAANRRMVDAVLRRADEPGELVAYWLSRYGRAVPKPVKRGVADAAARLYSEFSLLKYDSAAHGVRFADVLDLTHPSPTAPWQGDLFRYVLARRHDRDDAVPDSLAMVRANARLRAVAAEEPERLLSSDELRAAGMTWEDALSLAGPRVDKARLWGALIPTMGYMALLRNLRNFDEAGVPDEVAETVAARLADPARSARSGQLPFRFLSAHRSVASLRWAHALDKALTASLANVPVLGGRTLILVDLSGSMTGPVSRHSRLNRADAAKVFGAALALRAADATLVGFDSGSQRVPVPKGGSVLRLAESFPRGGGGTATADAVRRWYRGHDRVLIVTDEQANGHGYGEVTAPVPEDRPVYTWNVAGYRHGHAPSGSGTRHTFGGLTDAAFRQIPLLENGRDGHWPWEGSVRPAA